MILRRAIRRQFAMIAVVILGALFGAAPAAAQGSWTPITGASPAPATLPGATPGKADNTAAAGSAERYRFHRQWIEMGGPAQRKKYEAVVDYLKSVGIDPFAWTGKLDQSPRITYGEPYPIHAGTAGSCKAGGIEQPTVPIVFDNVYYGLGDDDHVVIFGMIGGNVTYGPLGQPYCDGDYCPPITVDGHTFAMMRRATEFRDCARFVETSLAHIGPSVRLLRPRDAFRNNPSTAFVTTKQFKGNPRASWKEFSELLDAMMKQ